MKRRFAVTLLAVAIAVIGAPAFAKAPVIGGIRDVVIADDVPATTANVFVYQDALNLNTMATDSDGPATSTTIKWSFEGSLDGAGNSRYLLNGRSPMLNVGDVGGDDPNNPGTKEVGGAGLDDPITSATCGGAEMPGGRLDDANVRTVTFRDGVLSPIRSTPAYPDPSLPTPTETVVLYASDGTSYSAKSFIVYTANNGVDRLSGTTLTPAIPETVPTPGGGWTTYNLVPGSGSFSQVGGLCLSVPLLSEQFIGWIGPYNMVELVQNNVTRIRLNLDANAQTIAAGTTAFWDIVIDNNPATVNRYGGFFGNLDKPNGANSLGRLNAGGGRGQFDIWFCPPSIKTASWNDPSTGMFTVHSGTDKDMRVQFRVNDTVGAVDGTLREGTICLRSYQADNIPLDDLAAGVLSTPYNVSTITASTHAVGAAFGPTATNGIVAAGATNGRTVATFSGGNVTIGPNISMATTFTGDAFLTNSAVGNTGPDAWDLAVVNFDMGDSTVDFGNASTLADNWPIPWVSDQLLMGTVGVQAPDTNGQNSPPDLIVMQWDCPSGELMQGAYMIAAGETTGLPKLATEEEYVSFFYTHNQENSGTAGFSALRMRVMMNCSNGIIMNISDTNNLGGVTYTKERVDVVEVPE